MMVGSCEPHWTVAELSGLSCESRRVRRGSRIRVRSVRRSMERDHFKPEGMNYLSEETCLGRATDNEQSIVHFLGRLRRWRANSGGTGPISAVMDVDGLDFVGIAAVG